jgi:hypothetical protein
LSADIVDGVRRSWRRPLAAGIGGAALVAGAAWATVWALGTCNPLDRLLGISGCAGRAEVADFRPLLWDTMVMPRDGGDLALFGETETVEGWRPALVRVSLTDGREHGRFPLALVDAAFMKPSADRTRVFLSCQVGDACNEAGGNGLIAAVADGATISVAAVAGYVRSFPGEPEPAGDIAWDAAVLPGGAVAVEAERTGAVVLRRMADGAEIRRLEADPDFTYLGAGFALVPSPSGRLIAGIDTEPPPRLGHGAVVRIWDVESGREVGRIATDPGHELQRDLAWSTDERQLVVLRRERRDETVSSWVETFDWGAP